MNQLYFGDCLDILKKLYHGYPTGFVDLIYIDPPFNSKRNYNILFETVDLKDAKAQKQAFADTWSNISYKDTLEQIKEIDLDLWSFLQSLDRIKISKSAVSYLTTMAIRIYYMHKILKDSGSFYLHCDPTMSHYLKIVCDLIFGSKKLRNEIVWHYTGWNKKMKDHFERRHDVILFYSRSDGSAFNSYTTPWQNKEEYIKIRKQKVLLDKDGREYVLSDKGEGRRVKRYIDDAMAYGRPVDDVWEIDKLTSSAKERLEYPTQKPEALLERIITASSKRGNVVLDAFCGCGTTVSVAESLKRQWIGIDISHLAIGLIEKRLRNEYGKKIIKTYDVDGMPKDIASARQLAEGTTGGRLKFEEWIIETKLGGIHKPHQGENGSWDGHLTFDLPGSQKTKEVVLIEAKSGHTGIKDMRSFIESIRKCKAAMGGFVAFEDEITKPMALLAKDEGYYKQNLFRMKYPKVQILSVESLLDGDIIEMPDTEHTTFKEAKRKDRWKILHDRSKLF